MEGNETRGRPVRRIKTTRVVVGFDPEKLSAPFLLRCGAILIDYIVIIIAPVFTILFSKFLGNNGSQLLNSPVSDSGWLIAILLGAMNFILLPVLFGQSIGKMLTGIRVVRTGGEAAGIGRMLLRTIVGYPLTALTLGGGFLFAAFSPTGRALHDYLAGTIVVYAQRRVTEKRFVKTAGKTASETQV